MGIPTFESSVRSLNQRWTHNALKPTLFASSRSYPKVISSVFGSRKLGSMVFSLGANVLIGL